MKILVVSATPFEIEPFRQHLQANFWPHSHSHFQKENLEVYLLVAGVGMTLTAFNLGSLFAKQRFDLSINAGIAGAFKGRSLEIGEVVNVTSERFADLGVEEADGRFTDLHELGLVDSNAAPFTEGELLNPSAGSFDFLKKCKGLTVNKVHGFQPSIEALQRKYDADVESMEGAAFFMACLLSGVPFLQIRSISNFVETRNREAWDLPKAIVNLNGVLIEMVGSMSQ
ncbi:MAG: futalosine hydrolase [Saprospiraceae bacterium]|nr:futalosine hydrolase [Saprospiraceae bacterium]MCF8250626.1 futalosine hydrolase [Saprospiraceae bacterium]MCF8282401.1 futalosine hydrolase [Bacteroidales bacterium]MCF8312257.1 futalosine hydrolase [Saprospiraceae bacterium]MCF8442814.1 futalosine hydrolase [Saprospiraceae bacterium]